MNRYVLNYVDMQWNFDMVQEIAPVSVTELTGFAGGDTVSSLQISLAIFPSGPDAR